MFNLSILIADSKVEGPGGLFDFDATLLIVAIQFIILLVILNVILYSPLLAIISERKDYIIDKLSQASNILTQANKLTVEYENNLNRVRKAAQIEIVNSQKIQTKIFETELDNSQKYIDNLLDTITEDLTNKKHSAFKNLDNIVQSLSIEIETKLSI